MWVGVDDGLYMFKNGHFRRLPEPNHQPLGLVFELIEDAEGNIWAECAGTAQLVRIRDFQVQEEFSRVANSNRPYSRRIRREEFGLALATGSLGCFATVLCRSFL